MSQTVTERGRPKGRNHVNGIEGFWSHAKTWLATYRYNHRDEDLVPVITGLLQKTKRAKRKD